MVFKPDANSLVSFGASQLPSPCRSPSCPAQPFPPRDVPSPAPDPHGPNPICPKLCSLIPGAVSHQEKGTEGCAHISCPARSRWCRDTQATAAAGVKGRVATDILGAASFPSPPLEWLFVFGFIFFLALERFDPDVF